MINPASDFAFGAAPRYFTRDGRSKCLADTFAAFCRTVWRLTSPLICGRLPASLAETGDRSFTVRAITRILTGNVNHWRHLGIGRLRVMSRGRQGFRLLWVALSNGSQMKAQIGAINPTQAVSSVATERRVFDKWCDLENAVAEASAMIDLLATKLAAEERGGALNHQEPPWVSHIQLLACDISLKLDRAFGACWDARNKA